MIDPNWGLTPMSSYNPNFPASFSPAEIDEYRKQNAVTSQFINKERLARREAEAEAVRLQEQKAFNEKVTNHVLAHSLS